MADTQQEVGPVEGVAPEEEAAQAAEADPVVVVAPVGADEPIGAWTVSNCTWNLQEIQYFLCNLFISQDSPMPEPFGQM